MKQHRKKKTSIQLLGRRRAGTAAGKPYGRHRWPELLCVIALVQQLTGFLLTTITVYEIYSILLFPLSQCWEIYSLCNKTLLLQEADTDEIQGSLGFDEFCSFYKMISTRRDLYLIMISYSNQKEVLDLHDLARFLENEQKVKKKKKKIRKIKLRCSGGKKFFLLIFPAFTSGVV